jgi:hypothetical protein
MTELSPQGTCYELIAEEQLMELVGKVVKTKLGQAANDRAAPSRNLL